MNLDVLFENMTSESYVLVVNPIEDSFSYIQKVRENLKDWVLLIIFLNILMTSIRQNECLWNIVDKWLDSMVLCYI